MTRVRQTFSRHANVRLLDANMYWPSNMDPVTRYLYSVIWGVTKCKKITLEDSCSASSRLIFASTQSFSSIFRDLQDLHTFAPLQTQHVCANNDNDFANILTNICQLLPTSINFCKLLATPP